MVQQAKHWAFTLNNYTNEEYEAIINQTTTTYIIVGKETGESGTPHLQGHCYFKTKVSARKAKAVLNARVHLEIARNPKASIEYCRKDGNFVEIGTKPQFQGHRSDIDALHNALRGGASIQQVSESHFPLFIKFHRSIARFIELHQPMREEPPTVIVYYGPTGTGKTRRAYLEAKEANEEIYSHPGGQWFDGYMGQPRALFDDFGGHEFQLTYLLKLLDRYPMRVPVKGSFVQWNPRVITITSNKHPDNWYPNAFTEHRNALRRRITTTLEITELGEINQ